MISYIVTSYHCLLKPFALRKSKFYEVLTFLCAKELKLSEVKDLELDAVHCIARCLTQAVYKAIIVVTF